MLLIFFISFFGIVGTFIISAIAIADLGIAFTNMEALMDFDNPANLQWLKIIQVVSALSMFLIQQYVLSEPSATYSPGHDHHGEIHGRWLSLVCGGGPC